MALMTETAAPPSFDWKRWPETEAFVDKLIATALEGNAFAGELAGRMPRGTGTRFAVWVDHLVVSGCPGLSERLGTLGYERQPIRYSVGVPVFAHPGGVFPRVAVARRDADNGDEASAGVVEVAIKVESVAAFS